MFCHKCGTKAIDGAMFCRNCGTKLFIDAPDVQPEVPAGSAAQGRPEIRIVSEYKSAGDPAKEYPKKRAGRRPAVIGVACLAVLVVLAVIFIAVNWEGSIDYEASVRAHKPFADNHGLPYTLGKVFDKYIPDAKWEVRQSGDVAYVSITGTAKGMDEKMCITVKASPYEPDPDLLLISAQSVTVGGNEIAAQEEAANYLFEIFTAYDEGAADLSEFAGQPDDKGTVTGVETGNSPGATEGLCYKGVPIDQLLGASQADIISIFGEPEPSEFEDEFVYGDVSMSFDTWSQHEPYLMGINGGPLEDYTYNGRALTDDEQKIIEIMGREPDYYATYLITYCLDCLGSTVYLDVSFPVDDYSTQSVVISLKWWPPDAPSDGPGEDYYDDDYPYEDDYSYGLPVLPDGFEWVESPSVVTDNYGLQTITGVIQNVSGKTKSYVGIEFNLYDYNDYQIGSASDSITNLGAGSSWRFEAYILDDNASSYRFVELFGW